MQEVDNTREYVSDVWRIQRGMASDIIPAHEGRLEAFQSVKDVARDMEAAKLAPLSKKIVQDMERHQTWWFKGELKLGKIVGFNLYMRRTPDFYLDALLLKMKRVRCSAGGRYFYYVLFPKYSLPPRSEAALQASFAVDEHFKAAADMPKNGGYCTVIIGAYGTPAPPQAIEGPSRIKTTL